MSNIRVRIAPSPTGIPHIGNTRTALFNYLFVRRNGGKFILRIEDTDRARFVPEAEKAIFDILNWLGFKYDEGPDIGGPFVPYRQSERVSIYKDYAKKLLDKELAYEDNGAIRFRMPKTDITKWIDKIGEKEIVFENKTQEDFIIVKSDGFPTYNFANVIDDHLMEISHVIRGEEFISSTPKHIQLYKAFKWIHPVFAHLPIILGPDKTKLSKRHGAKSVLDYRDEGYIKEALINFMALLGWNPGGDREIMKLSEMTALFDLKDVNTASPIFDIKKLEWFNGVYIRKSQNSKLKDQIFEFYDKKYPEDIIEKTIPLIQDRIKKLSDYLPLCEFFFKDPERYEIDVSSNKGLIQKIHDTLREIDKWKAQGIGDAMLKLTKAMNVSNSEFFMILRVVISGKKISPPLSESMEILGKEKVVERLKRAISV